MGLWVITCLWLGGKPYYTDGNLQSDSYNELLHALEVAAGATEGSDRFIVGDQSIQYAGSLWTISDEQDEEYYKRFNGTYKFGTTPGGTYYWFKQS